MKIKMKPMPYEKVMALPRPPHRKPRRPSFLIRSVARVASIPSLISTHTRIIDKRTDKDSPALVLMNHSCFLDMKIAFKIFYPRPVFIVASNDAMMGKDLLMRLLGCIPTQKYVTDMSLIRDLKHALGKLGTDVLMFPEAGYSFDGRRGSLPMKMGGLFKLLDVPVVTVITRGAFSRDPLYNGLRLRRVRVSAEVTTLATLEEVRTLSVEELDRRLEEAFDFDAFAWQRDNGVRIDTPTRAEGLHRILYRCPACQSEGHMKGEGTTLTCTACGKVYYMDELGQLKAEEGETEFSHIPDWYAWERACVREAVADGSYRLDTPVRIAMIVDHKAVYDVGEGRLVHDAEGFCLTGANGTFTYRQSPAASHTVNADFFWYEIGDVVGIGNRDALYYCFPLAEGDGPVPPVAKIKLAAEEMYRVAMAQKRR